MITAKIINGKVQTVISPRSSTEGMQNIENNRISDVTNIAFTADLSGWWQTEYDDVLATDY